MQTVNLRRFNYGAGRGEGAAGWFRYWRQPATAETGRRARQAMVTGGCVNCSFRTAFTGRLRCKQGKVRLIAFGAAWPSDESRATVGTKVGTAVGVIYMMALTVGFVEAPGSSDRSRLTRFVPRSPRQCGLHLNFRSKPSPTSAPRQHASAVNVRLAVGCSAVMLTTQAETIHPSVFSFRQEFQRLFDTLLGADFELFVQHCAVGADDPVRANHAHILLAVH